MPLQEELYLNKRHLPLPQVNLQAAALVAIFRRESRDAVLAWLERMLPKRLPLLPGRWEPVQQHILKFPLAPHGQAVYSSSYDVVLLSFGCVTHASCGIMFAIASAE